MAKSSSIWPKTPAGSKGGRTIQNTEEMRGPWAGRSKKNESVKPDRGKGKKY